MKFKTLLPAAVLTVLTLLMGTFLASASAQTPTLRGAVTDVETGKGLPNATIIVTPVGDEGRQTRTSSSATGQFTLTGLSPGRYRIAVSCVGYAKKALDDVEVAAGAANAVEIALTPQAIELDAIIVTASRRPEKALDAPAAVNVVDAAEAQTRPALTLAEHLKALPGVDMVNAGLDQYRVVIRGFNSSSATNRVLVLIDNLISSNPMGGYNLHEVIPTTNDDIDRIEVVSGPGSALYGPNAASGVMHIITKSPFDSKGTTVSLSAGERNLVMGSFRHAGSVNTRVGYKFSGQYYQGTDWKSFDPAEPDSIVKLLPTPKGPVAQGGKLSNKRELDIKNLSGDARLDMRLKKDLTATLASGFRRSDNTRISSGGAYQSKNVVYSYFQGRVSYKNFFAQAFLTRSDGDNSYSRRSGYIVIDHSKLLVAQAQHQFALMANRQRLTYGGDLLLTYMDSRNTISGRNEDKDNVRQTGVYLQSETELSEKLKLVAAARMDKHTYLNNLTFSPRAALVLKPAANHTVRVTYNRAFAPPPSIDLFLDLTVSPTLGPLPFALRVRGAPKTGWNFRRDANGGMGGLYMQSPFTPAASGGPSKYLPADTASMWGAVVGILQAQKVDLSALPPPRSGQVGTDLRILNLGTFKFDAVRPEEVRDIKPLTSLINNTFEIGYKGVIDDRLLVSADVYYSKMEGFSGPGLISTPNVFFNATSLGAYLAQYMPAANAAALAGAITQIPVGTVTPQEGDPKDILIALPNFGNVSLYGADVGLTYFANPGWNVRVTYSYASKDFFEKTAQQPYDIALNAPRHKANGSIQYQQPKWGWDSQLSLRYVHGFPVNSGVYAGEVKSYAVLDFLAGYRIPPSRKTQLTLSVQNLLNNKHREFVGTPEIGRLAILRLTQSF